MRKFVILSCAFAAVSGSILVQGLRDPARPFAHPAGPEHDYRGSAGAWFQATKPYCNSVEVETRLRFNSAPETFEGGAYEAACYALAGRIDEARELILDLDADDRWQAAGIVFGVAHPVADAGDDLSAGPIMELVVEFWPNHYMALYHAGISRYQLGQHAAAREHLTKFLEHYDQQDGWTRNARDVLSRMD